MRPVAILYATTSGSTAAVAELLRRRIGPDQADAADIARHEHLSLRHRQIVFLLTPTYGIGDCHSAWHEHGDDVLVDFQPGTPTGLIGLGDSRGHGRSFAGGIGALARLVQPYRPRLLGFTSMSEHAFETSPAVDGDAFPGLVLEYRRKRTLAAPRIDKWISEVLKQLRCDAAV